MTRFNMELADDTFIKGVLVIRLDDSDYGVHMHVNEPAHFDAEGSHIVGMVPTLWGWLKLWWKFRSRRRGQRQGRAALYITGDEVCK